MRRFNTTEPHRSVGGECPTETENLLHFRHNPVNLRMGCQPDRQLARVTKHARLTAHGSRLTAHALLILLFFWTTIAGAEEPVGPGLPQQPMVLTDVKLDDLAVTVINRSPFGNKEPTTARIDATGKVSLAKGDTLDSFTVQFTDPDGKIVAESIVQYKAPAPGTTESFKFTYTADKVGPPAGAVAGKWRVKASLFYKTGATPGVKLDEKTVEVK